MALAFWAMTTTVAPVVGPYIGGWITDNISWPWIFYINVPVGICAVMSPGNYSKSARPHTLRLPIDMVGLVLLVIGVGCLQVMFDKGNELDWFSSNYIVSLGVIALFALSVLIVWELTAKHPVMISLCFCSVTLPSVSWR